MTVIATKEGLLAVVLEHDTVEVAAGAIEVRGLSRAEVVCLQQSAAPDDLENRTLAGGMVDPALTEEEAGEWRAVPGTNGDVRKVSDRILELSGLVEGSQTAKERQFRPGDS